MHQCIKMHNIYISRIVATIIVIIITMMIVIIIMCNYTIMFFTKVKIMALSAAFDHWIQCRFHLNKLYYTVQTQTVIMTVMETKTINTIIKQMHWQVWHKNKYFSMGWHCCSMPCRVCKVVNTNKLLQSASKPKVN